MGIAEVEELVKAGEPVSPEQLAVAEREHQQNAVDQREVRAEVELKMAQEREKIEERHAKAVATANAKRDEALTKLSEKRQDGLTTVGLNPDGSDPQGREQAFRDK